MNHDLDNPMNCACFNIRRATRKITQMYDLALHPAGLLVNQFSLLAMLRGQSNDDGLSMTDLANHLGMDRTTLTRNLSPCLRAGWVETKQGDDRRQRRVCLTRCGQDKLLEAQPLWQTAQQALLAKLGEGDLAALLAVSKRLGGDQVTFR
jgi:DNA-binding MarR family transcriptional regulator